MPITFQRGQILGPTDLNITLRNDIGQPTNAYNIYYTLSEMTQGVEVIINPPQRVPANTRVGFYYAPYQVPFDAVIGLYRVRWHFWEASSSPEMEAVEDFNVAAGGLTPYFYTPGVTALLTRLRILLRDNNPDRNYRFAPPSSEDEIQNLTRTFGYIWEDYELAEYLQMALDRTNMYPPETGYSLDNLRADLKTMIVIGASTYAFMARAANWAVDEFSYSISAVSLDIDKMSKYEALKDNAEALYEKMVEQFKISLHIMKGLSQPRYGIGLSVHLGPFNKCITHDTEIRNANNINVLLQDIIDYGLGYEVLSLNRETGLFEPQHVEAIHSNGIKDVYELTTLSGRKVTTTSNHPFSQNLDWILLQNLVPEMSVDVYNHGLDRDSIKSIKSVGKMETFNLTVSGNHNFFGNDFLLKNSGISSPRNYASFNSRGGF